MDPAAVTRRWRRPTPGPEQPEKPMGTGANPYPARPIPGTNSIRSAGVRTRSPGTREKWRSFSVSRGNECSRQTDATSTSLMPMSSLRRINQS